jgi:hypothetical protein
MLRCILLFAASCLCLLISGSSVRAEEIGYVERFVLSEDRAEALQQLIPGTEDYYYYNCLHLQHTEQFDKADELINLWIKRHKYTARVHQILNRQALLTYDRNPQRTLGRIQERLNLQFNHQREILGQKPNLPSTLNQKLISRETLAARANSRHRNLQGFEESAFEWLVSQRLDATRRRHLLQRIKRPDYKELVSLISADLKEKSSQGFGKLAIHNLLMPAQLEELLKLQPALLNRTEFVNAWIANLHPQSHVDWKYDRAEHDAYLNRLWEFVSRLAPVHNSLKANVLYRRLEFDRARGEFNKERFMTYIKLPRRVSYINAKYMQVPEHARYACNLATNFAPQTLLPPVGNDEALVRSYLAHIFLKESSAKPYEPYINDSYLKHVLAETKIVNGLGDTEQWSSMLSPEQFKVLKDRVDLEFVPTNRAIYGPNDPVSLDLVVKNVKTLIVKVFEIKADNYYRDHLSEVDTDMNLDGLVANQETTMTYAEPPLRRAARHFDFPSLNRRGVFIIDFIGNGKSSRVLVRKGRLRYLVRTSTAGHVFTVLDDTNQHVKDASIWLSGHEYKADKEGRVTTPFTASPTRQPIILSDGEIATLEHFQHEAENYKLTAGIHVDRESLLTRKKATVVIRPSLTINGTPVTLSVLEDVRLTIKSTDHEGVSSSKEVADFKLFEDRESTFEFQVPPRLHAISFAVTARVQNLSRNQKVNLSTQESFKLNEIERTDKIQDVHLAAIDGNYVLELLGRTGEPLGDRAIRFSIKHKDFTEAATVLLETDGNGRVHLGSLQDIASVSATSPQGVSRQWTLPRDEHTYHQVVQGETGKTIEIPFMGAGRLDRSKVSLLELRGGTYVADRFDSVKLKSGMLQVQGLASGEYALWLKDARTHIRLNVVKGARRDGYVLGTTRHLEVRDDQPLQIASLSSDGKAVRIAIRNNTLLTRVHVVATKYVPAWSGYRSLSSIRDAEPYLRTVPSVPSYYVAGRTIGDEIRYIIDRKYATKFPGNSLKKPSLILNPWAVRSTSTGAQEAQSGGQFGGSGSGSGGGGMRGAARKAGVQQNADFSSLEFLSGPSLTLLNLKPDKDGVIELPLDTLGDRQHLHVVAVDPQQTVSRSVSLPESESLTRDLRLVQGLDQQKHYTEKKQVSVVNAGEKFVLADIRSSQFQAFDSLSRVYSLYATLGQDARLAEFSFIPGWPKLKPAEKLEKYSKYACHELNYFLFRKDPKFFKEIILPYLKNKLHTTFLDEFLIGSDLGGHRQPWSWERLNTVERILLSQRLKAEPSHTRQFIGDQFVMLPRDLDRSQFLFKSALGWQKLETTDEFDFSDAVEKQRGVSLFSRSMTASDAPADVGASNAPEASAAPPVSGKDQLSLRRSMSAGSLSAAKSAESESLRERLGEDKKKLSKKLSDAKSRYAVAGIGGGGMGGGGVNFTLSDRGRREAARQLYEKLDKTQEWAENNYYHLPIAQQNADLVDVNAFWNDYANHDPKKPFFSEHFAEASRNLTEMMFALAVLDLPFEATEHKTEYDEEKMQLVAGSPMVVVHQEIKEAELADEPTPILVSQNFFRHGDRHRIVDNEKVDKYVTDEFLTHVVYGCQIVVTNPTSSAQKLNVLLQVPLGAIPVLDGQYTRSVPQDLAAYKTQTIEYHFYFPVEGVFPHYPVHVAKDEKLIAHATGRALKVVETPTTIDRESWDFISQNGTEQEVLTFLRTQNLLRVSLDRIAFRLADAKFFQKAISVLDQRHAYSHTLWSYAVKHNDPPAMQQFLKHADTLVAQCGAYLQSPLVTIDPVERRTYEHLDYTPLVNARTHQLGKGRQILNDRLHEQYHRLLAILACRRELDDDDLMAVTYYLILQDRVEEALSFFGRVNPERLQTRLQHDYFTAYLDLYSLKPDGARALVAKYASHPVARWRNAFAAVGAQLDEIGVPMLASAKDAQGLLASTNTAQAVVAALTAGQQDPVAPTEGKPATAPAKKPAAPAGAKPGTAPTAGTPAEVVDPEDRSQNQTQLANTEPNFDFKVESRKVHIDFQNLKSVRVNYYEMDIELLFSRNPFVQQFSGEFSYIRPNHTAEVKLPKSGSSFEFDLPKQFHSSNVLVEVTGGGQTKTQTYYSHSLNLQVIENYGQVRVTRDGSGKPLPRVYVKVYAMRGDGQIKFYKDGYTDLRGRFDYTSLNTNELDFVKRFSILILSDEHGAIVREAAPPKQ